MDKLYFREFEIVPAYEHAEQIAELFSEYTQMLMDNDPSFAGYLELQRYDDELADLHHKYGNPTADCTSPVWKEGAPAASA